jgi:hypothetical protein
MVRKAPVARINAVFTPPRLELTAMDWLPLFLLWLIGAAAFVAACYAGRKRKP